MGQNIFNLGWKFSKDYYRNLPWESWKALHSKEGNGNGTLIGPQKETHEKNLKLHFAKCNEELYSIRPLESRVLSEFNTPMPQTEQFDLKTTYPGLLVGAGYAHETGSVGESKLGFQFDYTSGLPVIPGSTIKGVLRSAFPQFNESSVVTETPWEITNFSAATPIQKNKAIYIAFKLGILNLFDEESNKAKYDDQSFFEAIHRLECEIFSGLAVSESLASAPLQAKYHSIYKRDIFHDTYPTNADGQLLGPDNITPHARKREKGEWMNYDKAMLLEPVPVLFLKVMPNVIFSFSFSLQLPDFSILGTDITAEKRINLYKSILLEMGVGTKTNIGYGQLVDPNATRRVFTFNSSKSLENEKLPEKSPFPLIDAKKIKPGLVGLVGKVTGKKSNVIYFDIINVGEIALKATAVVNANLLDRIKLEQMYTLRVTKINALEVAINDYSPL